MSEKRLYPAGNNRVTYRRIVPTKFGQRVIKSNTSEVKQTNKQQQIWKTACTRFQQQPKMIQYNNIVGMNFNHV